MRLASEQNIGGFVFKADIKSYFDSVDQVILIEIIEERINDKDILWLIDRILQNYNSGTPGKGIPLGNWTIEFLYPLLSYVCKGKTTPFIFNIETNGSK
ncbi:hypothetical protein J4211_04910 [Candidatus Woesearchaeota archaeon]|nr:hypothetical protein [Candidatus Woesearchaeota archaeon]